jgi:hypothetical protein
MKVAQLGKLKFYIYANDHRPPHVHAIHSGAKAAIAIEGGEVLGNDGFTEKDLRAIKKWVRQNQDDLLETWGLLHDEKS